MFLRVNALAACRSKCPMAMARTRAVSLSMSLHPGMTARHTLATDCSPDALPAWRSDTPERDCFLITHPLAPGPRTVMFLLHCNEGQGVLASLLPLPTPVCGSAVPPPAVDEGAFLHGMTYSGVVDRVQAGELLVVRHPDPWLLMVTPADEMVPGLWTTLSEHARIIGTLES